jgi:transcriptional regulator
MYVPASFAEHDPAKLRALIDAHGFATLVTIADGAPFASHLPLALDGDRIIGHMARANPQWRHFEHAAALAVFAGPHAYVSPTWYAGADHVPTWNYAVVHVRGRARTVSDERAIAILERLVERYEPTPWRVRDLPSDKLRNLVKAIVAFELPIESITGKWKVGQNRTREDALAAAAALDARGETDIAALMRAARAS